jgi:hypothetical protein
MSELNEFVALITALAVVVGPIILAVMQWRTSRQMQDIKSTGEKVHVLVNNSMALALREIAELKRWKAGVTGLAEDAASASIAEQHSIDHDTREAKLRVQS